MKLIGKLDARKFVIMATIALMVAVFATYAAPTAIAFAATNATTTTTTPKYGANFDNVSNPIVGLINSLMRPLLAIVGAVGSIYCVFLGVNFAKAEEPQDREKAKQHLKNAIIGFALIFILILVMNLAMPTLVNWVNSNSKASISYQ